MAQLVTHPAMAYVTIGGMGLGEISTCLLIGFAVVILSWRFSKPRVQGNNDAVLIKWPFFLMSTILLVLAFNRSTPFSDLGIISVSTSLATLLGYADDRWHLLGKYKLSFAILLMMVLGVSAYLNESFMLNEIYFAPHNYALKMSFILLLIIGTIALVALPLIDGINGLFIGYCGLIGLFSIQLSKLGYYNPGGCIFGNEIIELVAATCLISLGMLPMNWPKARMRLGETGVWFLSVVCVIGVVTQSLHSLVTHAFDSPRPLFHLWPWGMLVFVYPIMDFVFISTFRLVNHRSLFAAGRDHLHHRLEQTGISSPLATVVLLASISLPLIIFVVLIRFYFSDAMTIPAGLIDLDNSEGMKQVAEYRHIAISTMYKPWHWLAIIVAHAPLAYLFWRGYTKVNPYTSGAVNERGRP